MGHVLSNKMLCSRKFQMSQEYPRLNFDKKFQRRNFKIVSRNNRFDNVGFYF